MSIRKHKGKIALGIAAAFWAACDSGSGSEPTFEIVKGDTCDDENQVGCQTIALYGVPSYDMSSAEISGNCDEGSDCAKSSSSVGNEYPNTFAADTSIHCKDSLVTFDVFLCSKVAKAAAPLLSETAVPVYGAPTPNTPICGNQRTVINSFVCTDGNIYAPPRYIEKDGVVYEDTTITEEQKKIQQTIVPADQSQPK